jgi:hypothetical protein
VFCLLRCTAPAAACDMFPGMMHAGFHHGFHGAHRGIGSVDWSKIDPEDRFVLLVVFACLLAFMCIMFAIVLCIDDAPAPAPLRQAVRRQFTAAEKIV